MVILAFFPMVGNAKNDCFNNNGDCCDDYVSGIRYGCGTSNCGGSQGGALGNGSQYCGGGTSHDKKRCNMQQNFRIFCPPPRVAYCHIGPNILQGDYWANCHDAICAGFEGIDFNIREMRYFPMNTEPADLHPRSNNNTTGKCWGIECIQDGYFLQDNKCVQTPEEQTSCDKNTDGRTVLFGSQCIRPVECTDMTGYEVNSDKKCVLKDQDPTLTEVENKCGPNMCVWPDDSNKACVTIDSGDANFGGVSRDRTGRCFRCSNSTYPIKDLDGYWTCGTGLIATMYMMRSCMQHMKPADFKNCITPQARQN